MLLNVHAIWGSAGVRAADAEVMESAGVAQGEFAAVIDGVVADAEVGRGRSRVGWLWAGWCRPAQGGHNWDVPQMDVWEGGWW
jgi:hypothetical protein